MLPGEAEFVSECTGLPGMAKSVKRFERSNGLDTALYKNYLLFIFYKQTTNDGETLSDWASSVEAVLLHGPKDDGETLSDWASSVEAVLLHDPKDGETLGDWASSVEAVLLLDPKEHPMMMMLGVFAL